MPYLLLALKGDAFSCKDLSGWGPVIWGLMRRVLRSMKLRVEGFIRFY